jgi:arylsulfatase A-like enzyme
MELPAPVIGDWARPPESGALGTGVSSTNVDLRGEALRCARAGYYGLINHVDDQIRRFLNPVTGIRKMFGDNTVVLLTADHGEMLGDHYLWRKSLAYEPAARIPLLLRAPKGYGLGTGKVLNQPVCLEDIMPTLLEFAGIEAPETVQGRSLLPLLRGEEGPWRERLHIEHSPRHHALTNGRRKFIWDAKDGREQFFDLDEDPTECRDLAKSPEYEGEIGEWRQQLVEALAQRPEGFSDGKRLVPGQPYFALIGQP